MSSVDDCGHDTATTDGPCSNPGTFPDGKCWRHTAHEDRVGETSANRPDVVNVRLDEATHERLSDHCRERESLSATVDRALDALERERELPDAVGEVLRGDA
jgi:hypothetical protein